MRWFLRSVMGKSVFYRTQIRVDRTLVGGSPDTGFGAWMIGADTLKPESIVYSVGVGDDISFDLALIEDFGVTVHAFDPTPASHRWLRRQNVPDEFILHKYGVAGYDGEADFFAPENPDFISHTSYNAAHTADQSIKVPMRRLSTCMEKLGHDHIDLLKLDIEGSEYEVIEDIVATPHDIRQLLVEFHHRFEEISADQTRRSIEGLKQAGFSIFYVSPNGEEYSLLRV